MTKLISLLMTVMLLLSASCRSTVSNPPPSPSTSTLVLTSTSACSVPVVVAIAIDQSGSMIVDGTQQVTTENLRPITDLVNTCGGEIGVAFIREDSTPGIKRLYIPPLPPPLKKPEKAKDEENYSFMDRLDDYSRKVNARESKIAIQQKKMLPKIEQFLKQLKPEMERTPSGGTDFFSAIRSIDTYLSEDNIALKTNPNKYLLVISDVIDTENKTQLSFKSGAAVLWINAKSERVLPFDFKRFENFEAATRFMIETEMQGGTND